MIIYVSVFVTDGLRHLSRPVGQTLEGYSFVLRPFLIVYTNCGSNWSNNVASNRGSCINILVRPQKVGRDLNEKMTWIPEGIHFRSGEGFVNRL